MKNLIVIISACLIALFACNKQEDQTGHKWDRKVGAYYNYNDFVDIKAVVKIDTVSFRKMMDRYLSPQRVFDLFGGGYNVLYAVIIIHPDGSVGFGLSPDAASTVGAVENSKFYLYKDNVELESDYAIVPQRNNDAKAIKITDIFFKERYDYRNIFNATAGYLNGKKVITLVLFQLDITIDNNKNIVRPWTITQMDFSKSAAKLTPKESVHLYNGYFPAILKNDYKFLKDKIVFPQEAVKRGVRGKVLVKLFFKENGDYAGYQLIKGLGYGCDEAVIKAILDNPLQSHPSGQKCSVILPFRFGISNSSEIDLMVKSFMFNRESKYNQLELTIANKFHKGELPHTKFSIYFFMDGKLEFSDHAAKVNTGLDKEHKYWFGGEKLKSGEHNYEISIDPENVLNDVDRSNNTVRGKLVIK